MSSTQHTPGPWQAGLNMPEVSNNNPDVRMVWSSSLLVCDCRSKWIDPGTAAANARLIAAAPELLEACQDVVQSLSDMHQEVMDGTADDLDTEEIIDKLRIKCSAAIAKAKGGVA